MTTATLNETTSSRTGAKVAAWVLQGLAGVAFLMAGAMKSTQPMDALHTAMAWSTAVPDGMVRFIGVSEFLGGLGLILPALTRIKPALTPLAGALLVVVMVLAAGFHVMRGELQALPINAVLGLLAGGAAYLRWKVVPVQPR
ncbi:MAG: DoxX family protein [Myxococcaceae bacterium]|nr:DoxX family protein [Myxococcaceae bacterium]